MEQNAFDVLRERGFIYQCTAEDEVRELLGKEKVRFYVGFDPTGSSLHVGHLLPVMAMRIMQKCGTILSPDDHLWKPHFWGRGPHA